MIDLLSIPFTEQARTLIEESVSSYWRLGRIEVVLEPTEDPLSYVIQINQKELVNNKVLTEQELIERGKNIFKGLIPEDHHLTYIANEFVV